MGCWLPTETTWAAGLCARLLLTTCVRNDRPSGPAVSCHSVPITASLKCRLRVSGTVLQKLGGKEGVKRGPIPTLFLALCSAPEDFSEHFQNKEFVCVGAQTASPRIHEHLHKDRGTVALGNQKMLF